MHDILYICVCVCVCLCGLAIVMLGTSCIVFAFDIMWLSLTLTVCFVSRVMGR